MAQKITKTTNTILDKLKSMSKQSLAQNTLQHQSPYTAFSGDDHSSSKFYNIFKYIRYFLIFVIIAFLTYKL